MSDIQAEHTGEKKLVKEFNHGDLHAFEELFYRHHEKIYQWVYAVLGSRTEAEKVVVDAFLYVWKNKSPKEESQTFLQNLTKATKALMLSCIQNKVEKKINEYECT